MDDFRKEIDEIRKDMAEYDFGLIDQDKVNDTLKCLEEKMSEMEGSFEERNFKSYD